MGLENSLKVGMMHRGPNQSEARKFSTRIELNRYEPAVVAAETGNQPTETYQSPLMRYTYNMPPPPIRYKPAPMTQESREDLPKTNEADMHRLTRIQRQQERNQNQQVILGHRN